jgi:DNA polymerase elongation subunit (family B)
MAKILVVDIETAPAVAYVWRAWDQNINPESLIESGRVLMVGVKFIGDKKARVISEWHKGHEEMIREVHALLSETDAVVHFNGDKFDLPILMGEFALLGLAPPPPLTSIDVLKTIKKFGLFMNRLAHVGPLFGVGAKMKHEGFELWRLVMAGDPKAQKRMEKYCVQDVEVTARLYERVKPYIKNHPHLGETKHECGACGGNHVQFRGYRRTKNFKIRRVQCQDCGSWSDGLRTKIG